MAETQSQAGGVGKICGGSRERPVLMEGCWCGELGAADRRGAEAGKERQTNLNTFLYQKVLQE